jgi:hypothetical protein
VDGAVGASEDGLASAVTSVAEHARSLVKLEAELTAAELLDRARRMTGAGILLGVGALTGLLGSAVITAAVVALIALALPWWAALLIVGGVLLATTAVVLALGVAAARRGARPPEAAVEEAKKTLEELARAR